LFCKLQTILYQEILDKNLDLKYVSITYTEKEEKIMNFFRPGDNVWIYCLKNISAQFKFTLVYSVCGLPWWLSGKECACSAGDASFIPG